MFYRGAVRVVPTREIKWEHGRKNTTGSHSIHTQLGVLLTSEFFSPSFSPAVLLPYPHLHKELRQEEVASDLFSLQELNVSNQLVQKLAPVLFFSTLKGRLCSFCKCGWWAVSAEHALKLQNRYKNGYFVLRQVECWTSGTLWLCLVMRGVTKTFWVAGFVQQTALVYHSSRVWGLVLKSCGILHVLLTSTSVSARKEAFRSNGYSKSPCV